MRKAGVIPLPMVTTFTLNEGLERELLILASDGVWEFISSQEAVALCGEHSDASVACAELIQLATERWAKHEGEYRDDISAIVLFMPLLERLNEVVNSSGVSAATMMGACAGTEKLASSRNNGDAAVVLDELEQDEGNAQPVKLGGESSHHNGPDEEVPSMDAGDSTRRRASVLNMPPVGAMMAVVP